MKSIITAFLFAFVAMSAFAATAADNPGWYVVYKMASTTTTLRGNETSKVRNSGYLVVGISEYADSICAESGNVLEFVKGEGKVYTTYTTGLSFKIQTQDIAPRWVGSSVVTGTSGSTVIYNRIEGISGSKFKLVNICHCVEEPNSTKYQLIPETVPTVLTGHSVNVIPNAVESTTSTYKLDVYASISMNHRYTCVDGHSFQLAPPASLDEAVEAFKSYIKTQTGGTLLSGGGVWCWGGVRGGEPERLRHHADARHGRRQRQDLHDGELFRLHLPESDDGVVN